MYCASVYWLANDPSIPYEDILLWVQYGWGKFETIIGVSACRANAYVCFVGLVLMLIIVVERCEM